MGSNHESSLRNLIRYSGLAFGAGYLLIFVGLIAIVAETFVRTLPYTRGYTVSTDIPAWFVVSVVSLFFAAFCGFAFGVSVVKNSDWRRLDQKAKNISSSVSAFSLMILFLGIGTIAALSSLPFAPMLTPICFVVGAVLLLVGYRVFLGEAVESRLIGGILMIVSIVLIYLVALAPLRNIWSLFSSILSTSSMPRIAMPLPGFLTGEINTETACLLVAAFCAVLYGFLGLRTGKGLHVLTIILSISTIIFGVGLSYFNFSAVSLMSNFMSYASQALISIWLVFFGLLILGISGIIIIVSAAFSLGLSIKGLQTIALIPPPPPPPPPPQ